MGKLYILVALGLASCGRGPASPCYPAVSTSEGGNGDPCRRRASFDAQPAAFTGWAHHALLGSPEIRLSVCDSSWVKPAFSCPPNRVVDLVGCRWRCVSILDLPRGDRQ